MKTPKYSVKGKPFRPARLLKSERTVPGCSNACHDPRLRGKCYNNGKCVNEIVRSRCNCQGTGYNGPNCSAVAYVDSSAGLRFHNSSTESSYAEFQGWPMSASSELQLYFKTHSTKTALLLYQDDGGQREFLKVTLVNGAVRLRLIGTHCTPMSIDVDGNFANGSWHKLLIKRDNNKLFLSVDDIVGEPVTCRAAPALSSNGKAKSSLFLGGIPLTDQGQSTFNKWSWKSLFYDVLLASSWFQGCVALVRYRIATKPFENAKLLRSPGVSGNCSGEACSSPQQNKCKNGGRCVDLVIKTECDCNGTGYYGSYCDRTDGFVGTQKSTPTPFVENTSFTAGPEHHVTRRPAQTGTDSAPTAKKVKKNRNRASSPVASIGWCLLLFISAAIESLALL